MSNNSAAKVRKINDNPELFHNYFFPTYTLNLAKAFVHNGFGIGIWF